MSRLTVKHLNDYKYWLQLTAAEVLFAAQALGGWGAVFPGRVPPWASKVRNYFNVLPTTLARLPREYAEAQLASKNGPRYTFQAACHEVRTFNDRNRGRPTPLGRAPDVYPVHPACPQAATKEIKTMAGGIATRYALSEDVYLDNHGWIWFQMSAGATIYHWGDPVKHPSAEAAYATAIGQEDIPIFKLIRMDGSGGSCEVVIANDKGQKRIGKENETTRIYEKINHDKILQGSYNYSETSQVGYSAHEKHDVKTHDKGDSNFYSNPLDMHTDLSTRRFPPDDNRRIPLYMQTDWWF